MTKPDGSAPRARRAGARECFDEWPETVEPRMDELRRRADAGKGPPGALTTSEREELARLRNENKRPQTPGARCCRRRGAHEPAGRLLR